MKFKSCLICGDPSLEEEEEEFADEYKIDLNEKGVCDACWNSCEVCQVCLNSPYEDHSMCWVCKYCKLVTCDECNGGGVWWCQCSENICKECFKKYHYLVCSYCETRVDELPDNYVEDSGEEYFCSKCNEDRLLNLCNNTL